MLRSGTTRIGRHGRLPLVAIAVVLCAAGVARAAAPLTWEPAVRSDSSGRALTALSCRSVSLCVAVDDGGNVLLSTAPLSGAWRERTSIARSPRLAAVSCPSAARCFAVDRAGNAYVGAPAAGGSAWSAVRVDALTALSAISCPSVSLCVAVDRAGNVLVSTSPADALSWSLPMPVGVSAPITAVSCPTVSLCVAVDEAGDVLESTDPASLQSWQATPLTRGALAAVSCNSSALCVAVAGDGFVYASADVVDAPVTWSATPIDPLGSLSALSCSDAGLCVLLDRAGAGFVSDDPAAARPAWSPTPAAAGAALTGVSCLSAGFCVAADSAGETLVGTLPPPALETVAGVASSQTLARLEAAVDPNDATLEDCHFDYGPTTAYGAAVPCAALPGASGRSHAVSAALRGLRAATTYHFRIAASSAVGAAAGADAAFTTPAPIAARPTLQGIAAVGNPLTCWPNVATTAPEVLTYAWVSDTTAITGATTPRYTVAAADETHHLSCRVTVSGDGGSAAATSGFDAVPSQAGNTILESFVGAPRHAATSVAAPVTCSPQASADCTIRLRLIAAVIVHHVRRTVTVGAATARVAAGATRTVRVALNARGRRLLRTRHGLLATLRVSGTIIGTLTAQLQTDRLAFSTPPAQHAAKHAR